MGHKSSPGWLSMFMMWSYKGVLPFGVRSTLFLFDEFFFGRLNNLNIPNVIHILVPFCYLPAPINMHNCCMPNFIPFYRSKYPHSSWENHALNLWVSYQIPKKWKLVSRWINSPAFRKPSVSGLIGNLLPYRSCSLWLAPFNLLIRLLLLAAPSCNALSTLQRVSSSPIGTFALIPVSVPIFLCGNIFFKIGMGCPSF